MILIQLILILFLLIITLSFLKSRTTTKTKAYKKILFIIFILFTIVCIIFPNVLNDIAEFVGVGRGADLLLYALVVIYIFQSLNTYIKDREQQNKTVSIVRKIAILEANHNHTNDK